MRSASGLGLDPVLLLLSVDIDLACLFGLASYLMLQSLVTEDSLDVAFI